MTEQRPFSPEYPRLRQDGDEWVISVELHFGETIDVTEVRVKDETLAKSIYDLTQLVFGAAISFTQRKIRHELGIFGEE